MNGASSIFLIFLLILADKLLEYGGVAGEHTLCKGNWETLPSVDTSYHIKAGRSKHYPNGTYPQYTPNDQPWFWEACPTQTTLHSCYYHGNFSHAEYLERRVWVTNDPNCLEFRPVEFLEMIRNRRVIMIGDSLLTQMWQVLVCALHGTAYNKLYVHWAKMWRCNDVTCPGGVAKHSNCYGGIVRFPTLNATIINKKMYKYTKDYFFGTLRRLKASPRDIVLVNYGLHYNQEKEYLQAMESFHNDLQKENLHLNIAFLETSPQHYPNANGYFTPGMENGGQCVPMALQTHATSHGGAVSVATGDWRNLIAHRVLTPSAPSQSGLQQPVKILPLAHGLYSQHEAHVGREPYPTPPYLDCTHWCFPSGALRYLLLHLHNGLRQLVGKQGSSILNPDITADNTQANSQSEMGLLQQALGYPDGSLLKGSGRSIFLIKGQKRCGFASFQAFQKLGLDLKNVVTIPDDELDEIPVGKDIE